jgi:hypothetical protein
MESSVGKNLQVMVGSRTRRRTPDQIRTSIFLRQEASVKRIYEEHSFGSWNF